MNMFVSPRDSTSAGTNDCDSVCQSYSSVIFPQKSPIISASFAERHIR